MKKKRMKWAGWILAAAAVLAAACYTVFAKPQEEQEQYVYKEETVSFGALVQGITENGSVELLTTDQEYELELETDEDEDDDENDDEEEEDSEKYLKIERVYITPGQRIEEGDPVFKLTDKSVSGVRRKLQSARKDAEIELAQLQSELSMKELEARQTYDSSTLNGEKAEEEYEISTQTLQKQIEQAYSRISVLRQENEQIDQELKDSWEDYDDLREEYEDAREEFERVDDSRLTKYIELRDAYLNCKERYETEKQKRLDSSRKIDENNEQIMEQAAEAAGLQQKLSRKGLDAKQQYEDSVQEGSLAGEIYQYSVESLQEEVGTAQTALDEAKEDEEKFEAFVGDGTVYAQGSGLVTEVYYEEGDELTGTGKLLSYVRGENYVISIDISEEDIPDVQVGDEVSIVFTAYPEETYGGTIKEITTSASSEHSTTVSYPVTVQISGDTSRLFGGMTGDVTFVTDQIQEALYVSRKAVVERDGKTYVYQKKADGEMKLTPVETGFTDGTHVQIVNGVSEGDTVYVASKM